MSDNYETFWSFRTRNFCVESATTPDFDLDLSWDEDGSIREALENGRFEAFVVRTRVIHLSTGATLGECYLGGCIYESPKAFIGDGYFRDVVHQACVEARAHFNKIRAVTLRTA